MSTTDRYCVLFRTVLDGSPGIADLKKVKDVQPWDSMRSVVLRFSLAENIPNPIFYAILVGRNNSVNLYTTEYYGLYNGLTFTCIMRKNREIVCGKAEEPIEENLEASSKSLAESNPFPFEDLPSDIKLDCLKYLELHNIVVLTQVSKNMRKIASLTRFWENISLYNNNSIDSAAISNISTAYYAPSIKKLDLSCTRITSEALAEITSKCTNLKELILDSCRDLKGGLSKQCSQLEVLSLNGLHNFTQQLDTIFPPNNTTLKILNLAHTYQALSAQVLLNCIGLEEINMNYNRGGITEGIIDACSRLPNLKALKMNWCPNGLNDNAFAPLTRLTTLKTLEYAEGRTTAELLKALCERNKFKRLHLQEVFTSYSVADIFNNSPELESFYGVIQRGNYKLPKTLKALMATVMWPEMVQRLANECPLLEALILRDTAETRLENDLIAVLRAEKLQNIKYLDISGVAGTQAVHEIANHCPNLEYLILNEKLDVTLEQLQLVQQNCKKLREVQVSWREEFSALSNKFQAYKGYETINNL